MRLAPLLVLVAACKQPEPATPIEPLVVEVLAQPEVSACVDTADLAFTLGLPAAYFGVDATLRLSDGTVLWEGVAESELAVGFAWEVGRGPVPAILEAAGQEASVTLPFDFRASAPPVVATYGIEGPSGLADQAAIDAASADTPWDDALPVAAYDAVAVTVDNPHADLGVSVEVEVRACLGDGPCTPLPVTEDGGVWRASLAARADARCDDLSVRDRDLFEIEVTTACGADTAGVTARVVHEDCDGDGVIAASDCDDEEGAVASPGDVAADGVPVASLADALAASDVVLCGGTHDGGFALDHDITIRSVGLLPALITPPFSGSTVEVVAGNAVLTRLEIQGNALTRTLWARDAQSLALHEVGLSMGTADQGGNLLGPANGALLVTGGAWVGGSATQGGNAWLSGGELRDLLVSGGTATDAGGGLYIDGEALLVDLSIGQNTADRGGGLFVDHALARVAGCEFEQNTASSDGGGIAAVLDAGQVLDLRPSIVDLSLLTVRNGTADRGGAVYVQNGRLESVLTAMESNSASRGGDFYVDGGEWEDSGTATDAPDADEGASAVVSGGTAALVGTVVTGGTATSGGVYVEGGAVVTLETTDITSTGCGVWIAQGTLVATGATGASTPADVCSTGFTSPFGGTCTESGCP